MRVVEVDSVSDVICALAITVQGISVGLTGACVRCASGLVSKFPNHARTPLSEHAHSTSVAVIADYSR